MTMKKSRRPVWIALYLSTGGILGLFLLELHAAQTEGERRFIELINILLLYGVVWMWVRANEHGLMWEDLHGSQPAEAAPARPPHPFLRRARRIAWIAVVPALAVALSLLLGLPLPGRAALLGLAFAWLPLSQMMDGM